MWFSIKQEAVCYPASMDGTPLGGDLQPIYPMERPAAIPDPFSLADNVENLGLGRSQAHKPDSSPAQTTQISERCAQEHQSYPPPSRAKCPPVADVG
jgi:hypothetical protein